MKIAVVGLGYVGLPLFCLAARKGFEVTGFDTDEKKIAEIKNGKSPIKDALLQNEVARLRSFKNACVTPEPRGAFEDVDAYIICVPTPVGENYRPDYSFVAAAAKTISNHFRKGGLIILESTVSPGTMNDVIKPVFENKGFKLNQDFYMAHCPERIDPGSKKWTLDKIPRVLGASSDKAMKKASQIYRRLLNAPLKKVSSIETAEATKIVENTFRDINIAFVNELAQSFDNFDIDAKEVIEGAATKPFGFMPHWPGCGVGGHCIAVDPYYMIEKAGQKGFTHAFLRLAREINNSMPEYTVSLVARTLNSVKKSIKGTKMTVLGLAYKGGVDDTRESPALEIINSLKKNGAVVETFDPYVLEKSTLRSLKEALKTEVLVITTAHPQFKKIDLNQAKKSGVKIIIDGRNILDKNKVKKAGIIYHGIGRH